MNNNWRKLYNCHSEGAERPKNLSREIIRFAQDDKAPSDSSLKQILTIKRLHVISSPDRPEVRGDLGRVPCPKTKRLLTKSIEGKREGMKKQLGVLVFILMGALILSIPALATLGPAVDNPIKIIPYTLINGVFFHILKGLSICIALVTAVIRSS